MISIEKFETDKLMREDIAVVWGGANYIGKNTSPDDLKHIPNFMQNRRNTIVLIMSGPHRCDLVTSSCVNNERKVFNGKLHKKMKMLHHTEIIDINLNMEHGIEYECNWKRKDCQKDSEEHSKNPH